MHKVFVYGTLRPVNTDGTVMPATHTLDNFQLFSAGAFPYIVQTPDFSWSGGVVGNIIEVDDDGLEQLDQYENVAAGLYTREQETVYPLTDDSEPEVEVFVYVAGPRLDPPPITSGDWFNR